MAGKSTKKSIDRFLDKVNIIIGSCWEWTGAITSKGYGSFHIYSGKYKYKDFKAHRYSYHYFNGELKPKLVIDHICRNRKCVNPEHLRQVTYLQNSENSNFTNKTHCMHGHLLEGYNIKYKLNKIRNKIYKECRTCNNINVKKYYRRKLAKI